VEDSSGKDAWEFRTMKKILVVDDESLIRYALTAMLQSDRIEVKAVPSGTQALDEITSRFYDLCFLDIHLPDRDGLEIARTLKDISPGTKIVIMTGSEVTEHMTRDFHKNAELVLSKPFDLFQVKAFVEQVLSEGKPLYRDETNTLKDYQVFINWLANDQRRHERKHVAKSITCLEASSNAEEGAHVFSANVIDISDGGIGIITELELSPGRVIRFFDQMGYGLGIVRWSRRERGDVSYRAGVQFITSESAPYNVAQ
jgi:CheY-like chemotaxis protein